MVFVDILDSIIQMLLLNVLLDALKIVVDSAYSRDYSYHSRKIEKIPVAKNTIPKNNNVFF
jgi:hypothetical protein